MKMDVEGDELRLLPAMVAAGVFDVVTEFMVEYHFGYQDEMAP